MCFGVGRMVCVGIETVCVFCTGVVTMVYCVVLDGNGDELSNVRIVRRGWVKTVAKTRSITMMYVIFSLARETKLP